MVSVTRRQDLAVTGMADTIQDVKRIAARPARFDGASLRFTGDIEISRYHRGELAGTRTDGAIRELRYYGHAKDRPKASAKPRIP